MALGSLRQKKMEVLHFNNVIAFDVGIGHLLYRKTEVPTQQNHNVWYLVV